MHLKVGELAKHSGLTVRTLHHYDQIGLLRPSARSEGGYRLYDSTDVARLHGIQALRHLGLELKDIQQVLGGHGPPMPELLDKQISALEREIAHADELRARLVLLRVKLQGGAAPDMDEWLGALALMSTYGKYFSANELKTIFENWRAIKAEWPPLFKAVQEAMDRGVAPDSLQIQPLAHRWMRLMARWMNGDMALMSRWGQMHLQEPGARTAEGPSLAMVRFISVAIDARMAVLLRHFDLAQVQRMGQVDEAPWQALGRAVRGLVRRDAPVGGAAARAQLARWSALLDELTEGDAALLQRLETATRDEPLLRAAALLEPEVRDYLDRAQAAAESKETRKRA